MDGLFEVYDADGGEEDDLLFAPSVSDYPIGCRVKIAAERISTNTTVPSWIKTELASLPPVIKGFVLRHQGEFSYVSFTVGDDPSISNNNNQEKEINVVHFTAMIHRGFLSSPQAKYRPEEEKQLLNQAAETVRERSRTPKELSSSASPLNASTSGVREADLAFRSHLPHQQSNMAMMATRIVAGTGESFDSQARGSLRHHPFDSPHGNHNHSTGASALPQPQPQPPQPKENTSNVKKQFASSTTNHPQYPQNQDITSAALVRIRNLRDEGNTAFSQGRIDDAIIKYSEALTWIPCSVFAGASSTSPANTTTINSTNTSFYRKSNLSNMSSHQHQQQQLQHQHQPPSSAPASYLSSDQLLQHQHSLSLMHIQNPGNIYLANNNNNAATLSGVGAGGALMLRSALKAHRRAHKSKCSALQEQQEYEQDVTFLNNSITSHKQKQILQKGNDNFIVAPQPQRNVMHFATGGNAANTTGGASSSQGTSPSLSSSTYPTSIANIHTLPPLQRPQQNNNNNSGTSPSSAGVGNQSTPNVPLNFSENVLVGGDSGVSNRGGSTPRQQLQNNNSSDINKNIQRTSSNNNSSFTPPLFPLSTTPASTRNVLAFPPPHVVSTLPPEMTAETLQNDTKVPSPPSSAAVQLQQQQQQQQQQQHQLQIQQYLMKREFRDECCTLLVNRSNSFLQQRSVRSAIRDAVAAVQLDPKSRRALMAQANSAGAANLFKYSLQALRMLYYLDPTDAAAQLGWCRSMISAFYTSALLRRTQECYYSVSSVAGVTASSPTGSNATSDTNNASSTKLLLGKSPPSQDEVANNSNSNSNNKTHHPPSSASIIGLIPGKSLPQQPDGRNYYSNNNPASSNRQNNNNNNNTNNFSLLNASISALGADDSITTATNLLPPSTSQGFNNNNNNVSGALLFRASLSSTSHSGLGATINNNNNNNFGGGTNELVGGLTKSQQLPFPQYPFASSQQLPPGSVGLNSLLSTSNCNQKEVTNNNNNNNNNNNHSLTPTQHQIQVFRRHNIENTNNNNNSNDRGSGSTSPQSQWIAGISSNAGLLQESSPLSNNNNNNNYSTSCRSPSLLLQQQQQSQSSPLAAGGAGATTSVAASASASVQSSPFSCIEENGRLKIHSRHFFKAGELICCEYPVCLKVALLKKSNAQSNDNTVRSDFIFEQKQQEILSILSALRIGPGASSQASKRKIEDYFCAACGRDILGLNNLLSENNPSNNNDNHSHMTKLMSTIAAAPSLPHPLFVPCDSCDSVVYCSEECKNLDSVSHSKFLCNATGMWANALRAVDVYFNTARPAPELVPYFTRDNTHAEVDVVDESMSSLNSSPEKSRVLHQPPAISATASPPSSSRGQGFGNNNNNNNNTFNDNNSFLSASGNLHLDPNTKPAADDNSAAMHMPTSGRRGLNNNNNNNNLIIATTTTASPPSQFSSKHSIQDVSKMNFVVKLAMTIAAKRLSNDLLREVTCGMNFSDVKSGAPPSTVSGPNPHQTTASTEVAVSELSSLSSWANCNSKITQQKVFSSSSHATHHFASSPLPSASKQGEYEDEQSLASILFLHEQQQQKPGVTSTTNNNLASTEMQKHQLLQPAPSASSTFFAANYGSGNINNNIKDSNNNNKTSPTEKSSQSSPIASSPQRELLAKQLQAATPIKQWLKQLRQVYDQFPTQTRIVSNTSAAAAANLNSTTPLSKRHNSLPPSPSATISPKSLMRRIEERQQEQELKHGSPTSSSCCCSMSFESFLRFVLLALGGCVNVSENNNINSSKNSNKGVASISSSRFAFHTIACFEMMSLISFGSRKEFWWIESFSNNNIINNSNNDGAIQEKELMQMILGGNSNATSAPTQQLRPQRPIRRIKTEYDQVVFSKDDADNEDTTNATPDTGRRGDNSNSRDDTEDSDNSNDTIVHHYVKLFCGDENIVPGDCLVAE